MRILIADDSRVMRQIVARTLRQAGFTGHDLVEAADGAQAYRLTAAHRPDLVICDWNMPEMTGVELLRRLRAEGASMPFGFVTAECTQDMQRQAGEAGAQFFIVKPFTAARFAEVFAPLLGGHRPGSHEARQGGTPTMPLTLPNLLPVRTMLADLLDRGVEVAVGSPFTSEDLPTAVVALYTDDPGRMVALLGLDLALAAYCGAALGLLPVGAADAALADGRLPAAMRENVGELCNVFAGLLNREGGPHVTLHRVYAPGEELPADVPGPLLAWGRRRDVVAVVARYGRGRLSCVLTD